MPHELSDAELFQRLAQAGESVMEAIFHRHYSMVCKTVYRIVPEPETAEDLAQEVFLELWRRRESLQISTSPVAYLRRAAVNKALNYLRDHKIARADDTELPLLPDAQPGMQSQLEAVELQRLVDQYIEELPEKCRLVFILSRFESLSHAEIAEQLQISVKTVENQMTKALRFLRQALAPYLSALFFIFAHL